MPTTSGAETRHRRARAVHSGRVFAAATAVFFVAMALWSFATPIYAAPDEPVQVAKAAAVVRGELVGDTVGAPHTAFAKVTVPAFYGLPANRNAPTCFHRHPSVPASCEPRLVGGSGSVGAWIYVARYPPLYYAIVGLPSLLGAGTWTIYLMRLVSALLSSLLIGLAVMVAVSYSRSRAILIGLVVAVTPMVVFLGGVVNPSGLEISAAICVWCAGSVLMLEHLHDPPPALIAVLAGSACVLELIRSLSPFWLALTGLTLFAVADFRQLRAFFARSQPRVALFAIVLVGALATSWILLERSTAVYSTTPLGPTPETTILETSFAHNDYYVADMVGVFGWFDTFAPTFTYIAWYGLTGVIGLLAAAVARRRQAAVLGMLCAAILLLPVAISSSQVHRYGYTWQGRDTLPLAVGLPILAAGLIGMSPVVRHARRLASVVVVFAALAQFGAFFEALRRYAVGTKGPDFAFLLHASWRPPLGFFPLLGVELVVLGVTGVLVAAAQRHVPGHVVVRSPGRAGVRLATLEPTGEAAVAHVGPIEARRGEPEAGAPPG